jgi:hypothetical protein
MYATPCLSGLHQTADLGAKIQQTLPNLCHPAAAKWFFPNENKFVDLT